MVLNSPARCFATLLLAAVAAPALMATEPAAPEAAEQSMQQFLSQGETQPAYRATRRLEARNGDNAGWLEAVTEYSPTTGFKYTIVAEGGSGSIRNRVLRAVLDGEREVMAKDGPGKSALAPCNYAFQAAGIDAEGLANVQLQPKRKEPVLVHGTMFLRPVDGELVRVKGRLAKSPSFWVKSVDVVRTYERVGGAVMPVMLETTAQVRMFGTATLRMTYVYTLVDGQPVRASGQYAAAAAAR
jgi:hypothetical protein